MFAGMVGVFGPSYPKGVPCECLEANQKNRPAGDLWMRTRFGNSRLGLFASLFSPIRTEKSPRAMLRGAPGAISRMKEEMIQSILNQIAGTIQMDVVAEEEDSHMLFPSPIWPRGSSAKDNHLDRAGGLHRIACG